MEYRHRRPLIHSAVHQLFGCLPQFCCFCYRKTDTGHNLCRYCLSHLPSIVDNSAPDSASSVCLRCGFVWPDNTWRQKCVQCVNYQTGFERIICPFRYDFPIDGIIQRLKYQKHLASGRLLGQLLARDVSNWLTTDQFPELLLPVPMNTIRYRQRGFNHAAEIAFWCGRALRIPSGPHSVKRRFDTGSLVGRSRAERNLHIRGAFGVEQGLRGRSVAIVDDVLTTGATAGELATELLDNGVKQVQLWAVARTPATGRAGGS